MFKKLQGIINIVGHEKLSVYDMMMVFYFLYIESLVYGKQSDMENK